jgi:4-hydroxy-3-methylbut-2-enyl diphosphate reductase
MQINIDPNSGLCFGVVNAINKAEEELKISGKLYCLGHIVHNNEEVERLEKKGLVTINYKQFRQLRNCKVLIRAHGEPPETYKIAKQNNIELIDASCKVVLKLQERIAKSYQKVFQNGQVVIYGKIGHAEVNGLVGQTGGNATIVQSMEDIEKIDFSKPVELYSQTTMSIKGLQEIAQEIKLRMIQTFGNDNISFIVHDTICRQVANRAPQLEKFALNNDVILFVSGKDSSNGKVLYNVCKQVNPKSYFISNKNDILPESLKGANSVGICGATSTPSWLMNEIAEHLKTLDFSNNKASN